MIRAKRTPLISDLQPNVLLKCEQLQPGGSYKIRGVERFLDELNPSIKTVQTLSAGNMARTLALLGRDRQLAVEAFVPQSIPSLKRQKLEELGVQLQRLPMEELWKLVERPVETPGKALLHPIDSPAMQQGYASLADEIVEDFPNLEELVVPFGVGGLLTGLATRLREIAPRVKVIAAERSDVAPLSAALNSGFSTPVPYRKSWVDAIGTPQTLARVHQRIVEQALVDEVRQEDPAVALAVAREIEAKLGMTIEGAAAIAVAASRRSLSRRTVCIVSGGNVDLRSAD